MNLRKTALWAAGVILAVVIIVLLTRPETASTLTMGALLVVAALVAIGLGDSLRQK